MNRLILAVIMIFSCCLAQAEQTGQLLLNPYHPEFGEQQTQIEVLDANLTNELVRFAERRLAAATAQVGAAVADLFPRFFLIGDLGLQSISASDWFTGRSRFWSIGPTISWPVFDGGRIRANIEIRNAQQEQALTEYEKTVLTAFGDVEKSLVNYAQEQVRYQTLTAAVAANRRAVTMAQELYIRGLNDYLNVLDTQRALYVTETEMAQSQAAMASNLVALYKALGGGWAVN